MTEASQFGEIFDDRYYVSATVSQMLSSFPLLSGRAQAEATGKSQQTIWEVLKDQWHPEDNPSGFLSVGVAENRLMHPELRRYIAQAVKPDHCGLTYGDGPVGSHNLRHTVAQFLSRYFESYTPLQASHVTVTNGVSSAIEHTAWAFADRDDAFLLGQPYYGNFVPDISLRTGVEMIPVSFSNIDPTSIGAVRRYEETLLEARSRGVRVKAIVLCNPHNPLGRCYSRSVIVEYLRLCNKYQIHFVSDEVYALSVWDSSHTAFTSVLSIDVSKFISPGLVHMLWGPSKDFGANGLRVGFIISQHNDALHNALVSVGIFSYSSSIADQLVATILSDTAFTESYIVENRSRLLNAYNHVTAQLCKYGIKYEPCSAGFFVWVNLGAYYSQRHPGIEGQADVTDHIMRVLLDHKVFLASGKTFGSEVPGMFRIVFAHPSDYVDEALRRITIALDLGVSPT